MGAVWVTTSRLEAIDLVLTQFAARWSWFGRRWIVAPNIVLHIHAGLIPHWNMRNPYAKNQIQIFEIKSIL